MFNFEKILFLNFGPLLTMVSVIFGAVYGSLVKQITTDLRFGVLLVIKNLLQVLSSFIFILVTKKSFFPTEKSEMKMLALRSTSSSMAAVTAAISYSCLPIFDSFAFFYSVNLAFGVLIARFYFKEKVGVFKTVIITLLFTGIMFVSQPSFLFGSDIKFDTKYSIGIAAMVFCGVFQSMCTMSVKKMKETYTHLIILYCGVCGAIIGTISYPIVNAENIVPRYNQLITILIMVLVYTLYLFTEINALKMIQYIKFQMFSLLDLPVAFLIDHFCFHTELNIFRWVGFACIVVALLGNSVYEYYTQSSVKHEEISENSDLEKMPLTNDNE